VVHRVIGFKKIKLHTGENLGYGDVSQPERQMHTAALWLHVPTAGLQRTAAEIAEATLGVAHALHTTGALILMSDPRDLGRAVGDARSDWFAVSSRLGRGPYSTPDAPEARSGPLAPIIFLFDRYPGGTGLCERLYDERRVLVERTREMVGRCPCERGCPGCIGPGGSRQGKLLGSRLLHLLCVQLERQSTTDLQAAATS
jgi:DEAD/DEAH box helicase domain-containing protein